MRFCCEVGTGGEVGEGGGGGEKYGITAAARTRGEQKKNTVGSKQGSERR